MVDEGGIGKAGVEMLKIVGNKLLTVCAFNAKLSNESDKLAILYWVMNDTSKRSTPTFGQFKTKLEHNQVKDFHFADFDQLVCGLIAEPLLAAVMTAWLAEICFCAMGMGWR